VQSLYLTLLRSPFQVKVEEMNSNQEDRDLDKVSRDADELLQMLDSIDGEPNQVSQPQPPTKSGKALRDVSSVGSSTKKEDTRSRSKEVEFFSAVAFFLVIFFAVVAAIVNVQRSNGLKPGSAGNGLGQEKLGSAAQPEELDSRAQGTLDSGPSQEVYFEGIRLPITNSLCNKKKTFCINGLARIVEEETGSAPYSFEDSDNGQRVSIRGDIRISSIDRNADGTRSFSFSFRDNQAETTPGWAAAGSFYLDQDEKQPGILTRFKTTESYGPKTPVGLENKSYLFPQ